MAVRSPAEDHASSPSGLARAFADPMGRPTFGRAKPGNPGNAGTTSDAGDLDPGSMRAAIQDGVLMVFGPDGDPVPPQAFAAAAAAKPGALVGWADGPRIEAERIAAVLEAQRGGRLGSGEDGDDAWIEAMLGIGPGPEMAEEDDLLAEGHDVEIVAFGKEMMISSPAGGTFLIAEARATSPARLGLLGPEGEPVALGAVVARLLGRADQGAAGSTPARTNEVTLPGCRTWIEDEALLIELPEIGPVCFAKSEATDPGPSVSVFMPDGETATLDDLLEALSRRLRSAEAEPSPREDAVAPATGFSDGGDVAAASTQSDPPSAPPRQVLLSIRLPEAAAAKADDVALVVIRGLPHGATLSAGAAGGDGSWLLSPPDLSDLSLEPPPGWEVDFALDVAAITVEDRDGELASASSTVQIQLQTRESGPAPTPIPIAIDAEMLGEDGAPLDAIVVRDLPAEATLSAGAYDPAIDGWVLLPRQMSDLAVTPGAGQSEDFTLTLLGISLADGRARSRLLGQIPIAIR